LTQSSNGDTEQDVPTRRARHSPRERLDLNAIATLDALLFEKSPTRAADRLGVTQSAVSHTLKRLREYFGDPLLIRTREGMVLTARAQDLADPIRRSLETIESALERSRGFDAKRAKMTFTVAMTDHVGISILPSVYAALSLEGPGIDLRVLPIVKGVERQLEAGEIDILFSLSSVPTTQAGLYRQKLFDERYVCLVRKDHPAIEQRWTVDRFCALDHLLIAPRGGRGFVDALLEERGLSRRVALKVPHFLLAPFIVAQTDLVLTLAERVARRFAELLPLRVLEAPLELPTYVCSQVWHERSHSDGAHAWLRGLIARTAGEGR
jgi:DNA-binding transcriptional LysR family regulator